MDNLNYDYQTASESISIDIERQNEIIKRDKDFSEGRTSARNWDEIVKDLELVYR